MYWLTILEVWVGLNIFYWSIQKDQAWQNCDVSLLLRSGLNISGDFQMDWCISSSPQVRPDQGSNHDLQIMDSTFHVPETPALTTELSLTDLAWYVHLLTTN